MEEFPIGLGERISEFVHKQIFYWGRRLKSVGETDDGAGHLMAGFTILRLTNSLSAPLTLANRGFLIETSVVLRFYVEQLAWAARARWERTDSDEILKATGEREIARLKVIYPTAGRIYGMLFGFAHHHPDRHFFFRGQQKMDEGPVAVIASAEFRMFSLALLLLFMDVLAPVVEALYYDELLPARYLMSDGKLKTTREPKSLLKKMFKVAPEKPFLAEVLRLVA